MALIDFVHKLSFLIRILGKIRCKLRPLIFVTYFLESNWSVLRQVKTEMLIEFVERQSVYILYYFVERGP